MSIINIADMDTYIRSYLTNLIKTSFPDIDISENSTFDDLYVKPTINVISPLVESTNTVDIMRDLSNADALDEDDLDAIGENNYGLSRNTGKKATTTLVISYTKVSEVDNTIIPSGTSFSTSGGLEFQTTQRYSFTPSEMQAQYNVSTLLYEAYVEITATETGSAYNVSANQIIVYPSSLSNYIDNVTNLSAITNGDDAETNEEYAARLNTYYVSRYVGTAPGYKADILALVSTLSDVKVIGKGDAEMTRDIITVLINSVETQIHIGGKTDIYVKGSGYAQTTLSLEINSAGFKLSTADTDVNYATVTVTNTTTSQTATSWTHTAASDGKALIHAYVGDTKIYTTGSVSTITIDYTTNGSVAMSETFYCGLTQAEFEIPFNSVISVMDSDDTTIVYAENTDYTILHQDVDGNTITSASVLYGSTKERTFIKFLPSNTIINGSTALITYTINDSVAQLFQHYESEEQRSTTVDILIKEAGKEYVNIAFDVQMKSLYTLDDAKKVKIQTVVSDFMNKLLIGESVKESDIVNAVYSDTTVSTYLSYIKLPFRAFYVPANITDAITDTHDANSYITPGTTEYVKLNKFAITTVS